MLFLSSRNSSACSATTSFKSCASLPEADLDLIARRGPRRVAGEPALAGLQELLRPTVIHALGDAFAPAQLGDDVLAAQASSTMRIFSSAA